ncbi:hypothetical protein FHP29_15845 [Nocardioides albidus]|uniref:Uncharacterized protein n=1 Tax=Nocardioides albidus TaxID=1517589 RepID=A0A5C4VNZ9_9ACTN|nr:hypothetical protein [Nocardioides albidus]TNM37315.1 hypothetical protein FHP29_15845 [Nocardioides albidus]
MRLPGRLALVTVLTGGSLTGCALLDGSSRLEEALEYLPADATTLSFVDRAAVTERVGDGEPETAYGTELARWSAVMDDAAFDDADVEWEAVTSGDGLSRVWKMSDDLDFDAVAADLEDAGFERSGSSDRPAFTADLADADETGLIGGRYPAAPLLTLVLLPDEELIVSGSEVDALLDVVADDTDSLADAGSFGDLVDEAEDQGALEYAALTLEPSCAGSGRISPAQAAQQYEGLLHPDGTALFATPDEVTGVRLFAGEKDAAADADGLATYLDERADLTGFDADVEVEADDRAVLARASPKDRQTMAQAWLQADGPFACPLGK